MALLSNQAWSSFANSTPRQEARDKALKLIAAVSFQPHGRTNKRISLRRRFSFSSQNQRIFSSKGKAFKISSFKGNNAHYDESGNKINSSNVSKNPVQLSYAAQEREEKIIDSPDIRKGPLSNVSEVNEEETISGSPVIHLLFKKWLILLRTPTSAQPREEIFKKNISQTEISETQHGNQQLAAGAAQLMKAALCFYLSLDVAIKVPPIIFIPWFLAVHIIYGAEVSMELMPLWVLGPLIAALYIKIIQRIFSLYVFTFKLTYTVLKNLPAYFLLAYNFVAEGRLSEFLWQPVARIVSYDYKELSKQKMKDLKEWAYEKYLDYIESIWPYYCRTMRFLKRTNFI